MKRILDIIRNNQIRPHSRAWSRSMVLKLCSPQAISITWSAKNALVLRKISLTIRHRLTPEMMCSTTIRMLEMIWFSAFSAIVSSWPLGFFLG